MPVDDTERRYITSVYDDLAPRPNGSSGARRSASAHVTKEMLKTARRLFVSASMSCCAFSASSVAPSVRPMVFHGMPVARATPIARASVLSIAIEARHDSLSEADWSMHQLPL